jgi:competence protein ComEA
MNRRKKTGGAAVLRGIAGAAGVWLCILLAGCGKTDTAMVISVGESITDISVETENPKESTEQPSIYVYVCGAVENPGVVVLPEGSRVQDALDAAGGFREDAAREAVNLAEKLTDGMKLYFPTPEEAEILESEAQQESDGKVNINTAGVELLCTLPGIGEARAGAIVAYREEYGAFESPEDIMKVSGIKENAYSKIKDKITVK